MNVLVAFAFPPNMTVPLSVTDDVSSTIISHLDQYTDNYFSIILRKKNTWKARQETLFSTGDGSRVEITKQVTPLLPAAGERETDGGVISLQSKRTLSVGTDSIPKAREGFPFRIPPLLYIGNYRQI